MCAPMKERRYRPGAAVVDGKIYVLGGEEGWDRWGAYLGNLETLLFGPGSFQGTHGACWIYSYLIVIAGTLQISWHYREVLWRDGHVGDRRGDAHESQLAQLRVSPAEEGYSHDQLSWDAEWQLSKGVCQKESVLVIIRTLTGRWWSTKLSTAENSRLRSDAWNWHNTVWAVGRNQLIIIGDCLKTRFHLSLLQRKHCTWVSSGWLTDRQLVEQSKHCLYHVNVFRVLF